MEKEIRLKILKLVKPVEMAVALMKALTEGRPLDFKRGDEVLARGYVHSVNRAYSEIECEVEFEITEEKVTNWLHSDFYITIYF